MLSFNLNQKTFVLVQNSEKGQVDFETLFEYKQLNSRVSAIYSGGSISYGTIIGHLKGAELKLLYQCMTNTQQLKAGKATALVSTTTTGKLKLSLNWQWLHGGKEKGTSEYIEINKHAQ
jgi:hypothetical protein